MTFGEFISKININRNGKMRKPKCAIAILNVSVRGKENVLLSSEVERVNNWLKPSFDKNLYNLVFKKEDSNDYYEFDQDAFLLFIKTRLGDKTKIVNTFAETWSILEKYSEEDAFLFITYQFVKIVGIPTDASSFEEFRSGVQNARYDCITDKLDKQGQSLSSVSTSLSRQSTVLHAVKSSIDEQAETLHFAVGSLGEQKETLNLVTSSLDKQTNAINHTVDSLDEHTGKLDEILDSNLYQKKVLDEINESISANNAERSKETISILEAINTGAELYSESKKILEELRDSNKVRDAFHDTGDYPNFIASPHWFSHISSKNEKNQVLYRNGYGKNDAVVLTGKFGEGKFASISSEYVFMENQNALLDDVPQSQNGMLIYLLSSLGAGFPKKRIGLSFGHNERIGAANFNSNLRQSLSLLGVDVISCPVDKISTCDIFIVAAPLLPFNEEEQESFESFVLDGGNVLFSGCGSYWASFPDEGGKMRDIADYPINIIGKAFRFRMEAKCAYNSMIYGKDKKNKLFFTPIFHVGGINIKLNDEQLNADIHNALSGNSEAQRVLAEHYRKGDGIPLDYDAALYWYKMSAFAGNALAQYDLGVCYSRSFANGIYVNHHLYRIWLALSAKNGELKALSTLGVDTYYGYNGVPKDEQKGAMVIKRAALQGRHNAQHHLGMIYLERGNFKEAGEWLLKACDSDNAQVRAESHYQLAFLLRDGKGFEKNALTAIHHLFLSAKEGNKKAVAALGQPDNGFLVDDDDGDIEFSIEIFEGTKYGLSDVSVQARLLKWVNEEFERLVKMKIKEYLSDERYGIYERIYIQGDSDVVMKECQRYRVIESIMYTRMKEFHPDIDDYALQKLILMDYWLESNVPDLPFYKSDVRNAILEQLVKGEINTDLVLR